jgi:hypothetical protein
LSLLITPNIAWIAGSLFFAAALAILLPSHRIASDMKPAEISAASDRVRAL